MVRTGPWAASLSCEKTSRREKAAGAGIPGAYTGRPAFSSMRPLRARCCLKGRFSPARSGTCGGPPPGSIEPQPNTAELASIRSQLSSIEEVAGAASRAALTMSRIVGQTHLGHGLTTSFSRRIMGLYGGSREVRRARIQKASMTDLDNKGPVRVPRFGLSGKLLVLTILFIMIVQVLIYVP
jgi:hypothetical protein